MNWKLLQNSLLVGLLTTVLSVGIGFLAALWLMSVSALWRRCVLLTAVVALALPPFLVTDFWMTVFGHSGWLSKWGALSLEASPEHLRQLVLVSETAWVLALMLWPISLLMILGAWQRLESGQLESDPALVGWPLIRWLLYPLARGAIGQAALLTFVLALNNFAVPALLQVKVFPAEVWVSFNTTFDYVAALNMSLPLVLAPMLLLLWFRRRGIVWPSMDGPVPARGFSRQLGKPWFCISGLVVAIASLLAVALPLAELLMSGRTWQEFLPALKAGQSAALNSTTFAAVTATLVVGIALLSWRWPLGEILWIPFLTPGVLLGIVLIFVFNRSWFSAFYQSAGIVFLAWTMRYLAVGWNATAHAMRSVDPDLTDAARLDGASGWKLFRHAQWPQVSSLVTAAWYVTYLLCLWDTETLILIMPPGGETLAVRVFNFLHYGHNAQVNALCLMLLGLAVLPLAIWSAWRCGRNLKVAATPLGFVAVASLVIATGCAPATSSNEAPVESKLFSRVQIIGSRGAGLGQFNKPRSVAVDGSDNLYVVDMTGRVQKFSPDGTFISCWQMEQTDKGKPKGMCRDKEGNIVVIEPHYSRVNHFSPEGKLVAQWGVHGTNAGQLAFPRAAAVNSHGDIFVSEYGLTERVQQFTHQGRELERVIGRAGSGDGEFNRPEGLGIDALDRLYVADSCNHRVQIFSPEGKFIRTYGQAGMGLGELSYPYDVRVDAAGNQFVCEFGNSRLQIFDARGEPFEILGRPGSAPGQFSNPWSIALDSKGNLYVADSMNHRVQKFVRKAEFRNQKPAGATPKSGVASGGQK
jgi:ABC-type Fe3+ transport system permease subunit/DNA-binding beta-propeller fold protein YncE